MAFRRGGRDAFLEMEAAGRLSWEAFRLGQRHRGRPPGGQARPEWEASRSSTYSNICQAAR